MKCVYICWIGGIDWEAAGEKGRAVQASKATTNMNIFVYQRVIALVVI